MSNYISALKRLEEDATQRTAPRPSAPRQAAALVAEWPVQPAPERVLPARRDAAPMAAPRGAAAMRPRAASDTFEEFGALFDALELFAKGRDRCVIAFAPVSRRESIGRLMAGLAAHAEQRRHRAFLAELRTNGARSTLIPRAGSKDAHEAVQPIDVDPTREDAAAQLRDWLDLRARDATLVFVEAPPLRDPQDALLLASACDGIVIVAEADITDRAALQVAAERVRNGDCETLGIAMIGSSDPMPPWMRRLLAPARTAA